LSGKNGRCFYLGSTENTLKKIKERLESEYPTVIAGSFSPPFREKPVEADTDAMIRVVNDFAPDVLFVGMGAPKQEKWVFNNRKKLNVKLICCIGAAFDFYAGTVKRSGQFWIKTGLEWLPRLLRQPARLWRRNFVSTPLFILYVLAEKVRIIVRHEM
jgi:N-acetylglucosaminyldiphosphoundecaprenol N-acetyl-beta-D-mannosaminyltransferase